MIANQLVKFIENQTDGWGENKFLPNDAIALSRITNLQSFANLVEEIVNQSGKSLCEVLKVIQKHNIKDNYPFVSEAINKIIDEYA